MPESPDKPELPTAHGQIVATSSPTTQLQASIPASSRHALGALPRILQPEELDSDGAKKLLLNLLDRLQEQVDDLRRFETAFHERDKQVIRLEERSKKSLAVEICHAVFMTLGGASLGAIPSVPQDARVLVGVAGAVLVLAGIAVRVIER